MIAKKHIFSPLLAALVAGTFGGSGNCDASVNEGQGSTLLQANMLSIPPEAQGELDQGEFELRCDGWQGALASSKLQASSIDFTLKPGVPIKAGDQCYVNVLRPDLPYNAAAHFPLGAGIYWASTKEIVYGSDGTLKMGLRLFKTYSMKLAPAESVPTTPITIWQPIDNARVGISALVEFQGDCRVFNANRTTCLWKMPDSCKVPAGEVLGSYEHRKWLACAADAATMTARLFHGSVSGTAPAPLSPERRTALAIIESLQEVDRSWNRTDPQQRADMLDRLITDARRITASTSDASSLRIRDEAVVYGIEAVVLPVLGQVKEKLQAGVPAE